MIFPMASYSSCAAYSRWLMRDDAAIVGSQERRAQRRGADVPAAHFGIGQLEPYVQAQSPLKRSIDEDRFP